MGPQDLTAAECGYDAEAWEQFPDETREEIQQQVWDALHQPSEDPHS